MRTLNKIKKWAEQKPTREYAWFWIKIIVFFILFPFVLGFIALKGIWKLSIYWKQQIIDGLIQTWRDCKDEHNRVIAKVKAEKELK